MDVLWDRFAVVDSAAGFLGKTIPRRCGLDHCNATYRVCVAILTPILHENIPRTGSAIVARFASVCERPREVGQVAGRHRSTNPFPEMRGYYLLPHATLI